MVYREGDPVEIVERDAPVVQDLTIPVKHEAWMFLTMLPVAFAFTLALYGILRVPPVVAGVVCGVVWLAFVVERLHRAFRDPGFILDDTAIRIPPIGLAYRATRLFYSDIRSFEIRSYSLDITTSEQAVRRRWKGTASFDRKLLERELAERVARSLLDTDLARAVELLWRVDPDHPELAPIYEAMGKRKEARRLYKRAGDTANADRLKIPNESKKKKKKKAKNKQR